MIGTQRKGVAKPQFRVLMQSALSLQSRSGDDIASVNAALEHALFPQAEIRDMAYEGFKALRELHSEQGAQMQRMALRKPEIEVRHQMGSELFYSTKAGIMKFELWEARGYFVNI